MCWIRARWSWVRVSKKIKKTPQAQPDFLFLRGAKPNLVKWVMVYFLRDELQLTFGYTVNCHWLHVQYDATGGKLSIKVEARRGALPEK